tara:strand:- start:2207 stop:2692 length:486 start_codon:yes stop_codon:yes gene_type:complete
MNNGRVNIMGPNTSDLFKLYEQVPLDNESTSYKDAMIGNWQSTVLSDAFFSAENIRIIQNAIKAAVYHGSKTMYVIGDQNEDTLKIIMRSTFLQYSSNKPHRITEQITALNKLVVDYAAPQILSEAKAYTRYKHDVSTIATPMARPKSTMHTNTLYFKGWF